MHVDLLSIYRNYNGIVTMEVLQNGKLNKLKVSQGLNTNSTLALVIKSLIQTNLGRHLNCVVETEIESGGPVDDSGDLLH